MNGKRAKQLRFMSRLLSQTVGATENTLKVKRHIQYDEDGKEIRNYEVYYSEFSPRRTYQDFKRLVKSEGIVNSVYTMYNKFANAYEENKNKEKAKEAAFAT